MFFVFINVMLFLFLQICFPLSFNFSVFIIIIIIYLFIFFDGILCETEAKKKKGLKEIKSYNRQDNGKSKKY